MKIYHLSYYLAIFFPYFTSRTSFSYFSRVYFFFCVQLKLFLIKLDLFLAYVNRVSGVNMQCRPSRVNRILGRVNISTCTANIRKLFLGEGENAEGLGDKRFSPIPDRGISGNQPIVAAAQRYAFRVGFVATPKPGCGWCWCCCSLLGETSRKLYTHTCTRARTHVHVAHIHIHSACKRANPSTYMRTRTHEFPPTPCLGHLRERARIHIHATSRTYTHRHVHTSEGGNERSSRTYSHAHPDAPWKMSITKNHHWSLSLCHSPCSPLIPLSLHRFLPVHPYIRASPRSSFSPLRPAPVQGIFIVVPKVSKDKKTGKKKKISTKRP